MKSESDVIKAAIVAYCINKLGGEVRISRQVLDELIEGSGAIYIQGDPVTDEYIIRTEQVIRGKESSDAKQEFQEKYNDEILHRLLENDWGEKLE